jgi:glutamate-1-semialdehyde 2,1-aminomutase
MGRGQELYEHAKAVIPGGTQLLSKRPEQFLPGQWPAYYSRAKGCEVWDLDGRKYTDASYMGIGDCALGYADPEVDGAVLRVIADGAMSTLNAPEEVELAELLVRLHPWARMVRYARTGGEAMAVAVRIARAASGRDTVLFCGYHGWSDWYLSANLADDSALDGQLLPGLKPAGVPRGLRGTALPFVYNDIAAFRALVSAHGHEIGAIVLEPIRNIQPKPGFLETVREDSSRLGVPLVADEVSSGWRMNLGGAHLVLGMEPDIAVFAKALSNGYPMAAVIGKAEVMDAAQSSFISSTNWTERIGPTAAIATLKKMKDSSVQKVLSDRGKAVQDGWTTIARKQKVGIHVGGIYPMGHFDFDHPEPLVLKTLFTQEMLESGYLATNAFYASFAHTEQIVGAYLEACNRAFATIRRAMDQGNPASLLKGPVCQFGFRRLT